MKSARGEIAILGRGDHTRNMFGTSLHTAYCKLSYCTRNSRKNAIVLRPLRAIASHELLHELLRRQTTIAATPLAESTPSPNSQERVRCTLIFREGAVLSKFRGTLLNRAPVGISGKSPPRRSKRIVPSSTISFVDSFE